MARPTLTLDALSVADLRRVLASADHDVSVSAAVDGLRRADQDIVQAEDLANQHRDYIAARQERRDRYVQAAVDQALAEVTVPAGASAGDNPSGRRITAGANAARAANAAFDAADPDLTGDRWTWEEHGCPRGHEGLGEVAS